jgi:hypothetical protein
VPGQLSQQNEQIVLEDTLKSQQGTI